MLLALGFAELLIAVIAGTAAVTGSSIGSVVRGHPDRATSSSTAGPPAITNVGGGQLAGTATFEGHQVAAWIAPVLTWARAHGWKGTVTSGYRSFAAQKSIYDSGVRPAARPGTSNHEQTAFPGGAVDVTNPSQLAAVLRNSPYASQLVWAGAKDPVHFSHPHNGSY